jgi:hypothetical protein
VSARDSTWRVEHAFGEALLLCRRTVSMVPLEEWTELMEGIAIEQLDGMGL